MQKPLLIVLLLALALGGGLFAFLMSSGPEAAGLETEQAVAPSVALGASSEPDLAAPAEATEAADDVAPRPRADRRASAFEELEDVGERRSWDPASSVYIEGSVVIPPTCPLDEIVEVVALEGDFDPVGRVRDFPLSDDLVPTGFLARVEVERDGAFRIGVPPDVRSAWLLVRGHYLYSKTGREVNLASGASAVVLEPSVGAWISGTLVPPADASPAQREMEGTAVRAEPERLSDLRGVAGLGPDAPPSRGTTVAADLTFEIRGLQTGRAYTFGAIPELLAASKSEPLDPQPGEHLNVEIPLTYGATLAGTLLDEEGQPVEGAELEVLIDTIIYGQGGATARETETAADGSFRLEAVPAGESLLSYTQDGFIPASQELELLEGQVMDEMELVLGRGRRVTGRVVWPDGAPAAEAEVDLTFDMSQMGGMAAFNAMSGAEGSDETDENGEFVITGLGNGPFTVRATISKPEDDAPEDEGRTWLARADGVRPDPVGKDPEERLTLELEPPIGFAGRVLDEQNEPLPAFTIHVRSDEGGLFAAFGSDGDSAGFENEDGTFFFDGLRAGDWFVMAACEGYGAAEPVKVKLPRPDDAERIELSLFRLATLSGVVQDPDGRPISGADVGRQRTPQEIRRIGLLGDDSERARTDKEGKFTIEGITPGSVSLVAEAAGFAESEPVGVEVTPSQSVDSVVLTLRVGGKIVGEVYDADGEPEAGSPILAQRPSALGLQRWARSDAEGKFTIENMIPGSYQVMVMPDQETVEGERGEDDFTSIFAEMRLTMVDVKDEEESFVQLGSPPGDPVRVYGQVELDSRGVPEVMVTFVPDGGERGAMRFTTTDERGEYELEVTSPGRYMVSMQKIGGTGQSQSLSVFEDIPEADDHRLNLGLPVGKITGRVIGADGQPAVKERVTLFSEAARLDGNYAEAQTDEEGRYELGWLRGGSYTVAAGGVFMGGVIGEATGNGRQLLGGVRVDEGQWVRDVDFRMKRSARLAGRVLDENGNPVIDASIYLIDENGRHIEAFSTVVTDGTGKFEYEGVQPGTYGVRARAKGRASAEPVMVRLREGETAKPELKLDTGTTLIIKLVDESGAPLQAAVEVFDQNDQEVGGMLSLSEIMEIFMQGNFSSTEPRVGPLAAGRYKVVAEAMDGRKASKMVTLRGQKERSLKLRLK